MEGEGAYAIGPAALVRREREEDVGRLRPAVGRPRVVRAALKRTIGIAPKRYRDTARAAATG
ncbi:hypothetical protein ACWC0A_25095 [Streptomyces scopuliridis]